MLSHTLAAYMIIVQSEIVFLNLFDMFIKKTDIFYLTLISLYANKIPS